MENADVKSLLEVATKELETMLGSKTVVGEPMELHGRTIVPLISVGFGTALGAGKGTDKKMGEGGGSGLGCGGGARPVAILISDASGVRIEAIKGGAASAAEHVAETIAAALKTKDKAATDSGADAE